MPTGNWEAFDLWHDVLPNSILAWAILLSYGLIFLALLLSDRSYIRPLSLKGAGILLFLSGLAFALSGLFPTQSSIITAQLLPFDLQSASKTILALLSAVPYLLAGALMGPTAALIVGFFTGLGHTFGLTQLWFVPFHYAFVAWLAAHLMQQNYHGRIYSWLRSPIISGTISQLAILILSTFIAVVTANSMFLIAIDTGLSKIQVHFWPFVLVGFVSGLVVALIVKIWFRSRPPKEANLSPPRNSIQHLLIAKYLIFSGVFLSIGIIIMFAVTLHLTTRLLIAQMAANSHLASTLVSDFQTNIEDELDRFGNEKYIVGEDKASMARALGSLFRAAESFQRVVLVSDDMGILYAYPPEEKGLKLTEEEIAAVSHVLDDGVMQRVVSEISDEVQMLSVVVPVLSEGNQTSVLIGRVSATDLAKMIDIAGDEENNVSRHIFDDEDQLIAHTNNAKPMNGILSWTVGVGQGLDVPGDLGGQALLSISQDGLTDLVYITPRTAHSWYIAAVVPYDVVLNRSLLFSMPLIAILIIVAAVFFVQMDRFGRGISMPISEMARTSRLIAEGGNLTTRVYTNRHDEIGDLSLAFAGMQLALKGRLEELSLLLNVSKDISSSINISQSMPVILQGALRGTGASGARALILDPSGSVPLAFTEGPSASDMAALDRPLMTLLRQHDELALGSPKEMRSIPGLVNKGSAPVNALYALPLRSSGNFLGILYLGFRQPREFTLSEHTLIRTLAGQAAVLVENAYLFANAEGGRRRLAAVLASTSEAVVVTDQSNRILIINRAMERAFQLSANQVKGRLLTDVIDSKALAEALTQAEPGTLDLEIEGKDNRSYNINVSPIVSQRGLVMGRVALLHDVTQFKEIDRLKSDFVSNVSHDLRTPLTVMSGYATALAMTENLSSEQREYTDNIVLSVERMSGLVDNLLDLGRIEAGVDLFFEEVEVFPLLKELAEEYWLYAHDSGVNLEVKAQRDLPPIMADRTLLGQAVSNLLANGFKYAPNSGVMTLASEREGNEIVISLSDNGPGIAGQDQIRLFEKFYRVKRHGSGSVKGSGLGLAIVKSIADRHGGRAWCRSEPGRGSTFYISMPIKQRDMQETAS